MIDEVEVETLSKSIIADYELLSKLFEYPRNDYYSDRAKEARQYLSYWLPEAAEAMDPFAAFASSATLTEMQELFLRSFDVQAITTLDIGFILFGEDYKRGQLLVHLNREHREAGNVCETELSDHLPNVLRLLPKMNDHGTREELVLMLVIPAIEKMIGEFEIKKIEKKDEVYKKHLKTIIEYSPVFRTIYQSLLHSILMVLKKDFGTVELPDGNTFSTVESEEHIYKIECGDSSENCSQNKVADDFGGTIENELNIEKL